MVFGYIIIKLNRLVCVKKTVLKAYFIIAEHATLAPAFPEGCDM